MRQLAAWERRRLAGSLRELKSRRDGGVPDEDPNHGWLVLANRAPGEQFRFPAKDIVDPGFLELVRYGIRRPDDPVIVDSLRVVAAVLRVETPLEGKDHQIEIKP
jgi:GH15 family glucan-1,4-alpha-glucosidase